VSIDRPIEPTVEQAGERRSARIESLRALAALAVLLGHITIASIATAAIGLAPEQADQGDAVERLLLGGGLGVFLFFTLTGYLLFWPFVRAGFGDSPPVRIGTYARNRILRILPLYFAVVLVVFLVEGADPGQPGLLRYLSMTQLLDRQAGIGIDSLGPLWSVVVEVHFYVLLPIGAWLLSRISGSSLRRAALVLIALGLLSLAIRIAKVNGTTGPPPPFWRLNLPANFLFFVPGMLLALLRLQTERLGRLPLPDALCNSNLWIAASVPLILLPIYYSYDFTPVICVCSFLLVGGCVLPMRESGLARALDWRPLALLGVASYSLYAWHAPVLVALDRIGVPFTPWTVLAMVAVPLSIAVAAASYFAIESPFLRLRRVWSRDAASESEPSTAETRPGTPSSDEQLRD
jgi:peptidoglycan/LPS O-acetylase OafA/YrhL